MGGPQQPKKRVTRRTTNYKNADDIKEIELTPRNENQGLHIQAMKDSSQVIVIGPAGVGKTYITATHAANLYNKKKIDKIIITRPHVGVSKDIGYLPGTVEEKVYPWALPVLDVFERHMGVGKVDTALKNKNIEIVPLALIRGRSFDDAFIICDVSLNMIIAEMKALLTRVGEDSQIVLDGDVQQSDIKEQSGLSKIAHLAKKYSLTVPVIEYTIDDVVRSDICKQWIRVFMEEGL